MADTMSDLFNEIMNIDDSISASSPSHTLCAKPSDVFPCDSLLHAINVILYYNTYDACNVTTLSVFQEELFVIIEQLREYPQKMFMYLQKHFAEHFDTNLNIIAFDKNKFTIINNVNPDKKYIAFLSFNQDNTVYGPLYTVRDDGSMETVFSIDNVDICLDAYMYVDQLNTNKPLPGSPQIQEQQAVHCAHELNANLSALYIPTSTNQSIQLDPGQVDVKLKSRMMLDYVLQQMFRIFDDLPVDPDILCQALQPFASHIANFEHLSPQGVIMASKDGINCLSHLLQLVEQPPSVYQNEQVDMSQRAPSGDISNQNVEIQNETNQTPSNADVPLHTSSANAVLTTTADVHNPPNEEPINIEKKYVPPALSKPLQSTFHPRNFKEYSIDRSSPIKCVDCKQRIPLQIQVPPNDNTSLYLAMKVADVYGQTHPSKILVPHKTRAENELLMNNNDLNCLNFTECDNDCIFDCKTKRLYSKISPKERQDLQKEIRIHMINLYQRGEITRDRIKGEDLKKWHLAFWFCVFENGIFKPVSPVSYSAEIVDSKKSVNPKKTIVKKNIKRLSKTTTNAHQRPSMACKTI